MFTATSLTLGWQLQALLTDTEVQGVLLVPVPPATTREPARPPPPWEAGGWGERSAHLLQAPLVADRDLLGGIY